MSACSSPSSPGCCPGTPWRPARSWAYHASRTSIRTTCTARWCTSRCCPEPPTPAASSALQLHEEGRAGLEARGDARLLSHRERLGGATHVAGARPVIEDDPAARRHVWAPLRQVA